MRLSIPVARKFLLLAVIAVAGSLLFIAAYRLVEDTTVALLVVSLACATIASLSSAGSRPPSRQHRG